ncbi:MAG: glutamine amidotransferase, partial [Hyphomicrobiales bacterium]|nr:glutamine amidotransferase [Hyphomicrobiales bacterium]
FQYGPNAVALQFHPEVTYAMMCRWTTRAYERMQSPNARQPHEHLEGWFQHDRTVGLWLDMFLRNWLASGAAKAGKRPAVESAWGAATMPLAAAPA